MKQYRVIVNGTEYEVFAELIGDDGKTAAPVAAAPAPAAAPAGAGESITCPMPGTIVKVPVKAGQAVKKGDVLCVFEAMKMENEVMAPRDGVVSSVNVNEGATVNSGDVLLVLG